MLVQGEHAEEVWLSASALALVSRVAYQNNQSPVNPNSGTHISCISCIGTRNDNPSVASLAQPRTLKLQRNLRIDRDAQHIHQVVEKPMRPTIRMARCPVYILGTWIICLLHGYTGQASSFASTWIPESSKEPWASAFKLPRPPCSPRLSMKSRPGVGCRCFHQLEPRSITSQQAIWVVGRLGPEANFCRRRTAERVFSGASTSSNSFPH